VLDNLIFSIALSTHIGLHGDFNSVHPHAQYQLPNNYITGVYHNSDKRASIYFGKRTKYKQLDIEYGVVHGYKRIDIAPMIKVNYGNVFVTPAATEDDVGLVAGYEVKF
tara:strand:+ start:34870 stop:35196 length:327 start_codon:yes stop_codon:yes gene_type:complete